MTRPRRLRKLLLTPLVYLAALILLFEEWCWDTGVAIARWLAARLPLQALDERIRKLPPYAALARTALARLVDHLARAVAGVASALYREEALLRPQPAVTFAGRALVRLRTGLGAGTVADLAGN